MHNPIEAHGDLAPQLWETYVAASRAPQPMDSLTLSEFKPERRRSSVSSDLRPYQGAS